MNAFSLMLGRKRKYESVCAGFDARTIAAVWNKAQAVLGVDPNVFRKPNSSKTPNLTVYFFNRLD